MLEQEIDNKMIENGANDAAQEQSEFEKQRKEIDG
jgi:hypothetical protein